MYKLYDFPISQHCRRVTALLTIAGIEYERVHVAMDKGEYLEPDYLAINPNHQLPTLVDGNVKIHESNAILRYLCLKHGLEDWYPNDLERRAQVEQWLDWCQCRLGPATVDIVFNTVFAGPMADKKAIERGHEKMKELRPILNDALADKAYLAGDTPTIADLALASNITHLAFADASPTEPNILAWLERVCAIEGFRNTIPQLAAA